MRLCGISMPNSSIVALNCSRSSPRLIASHSTPMICTPYCSRTPASASWLDRFNPVWPPRLGSSASGLVFAMISVRDGTFSGAMKVWSAITGSVMMVAGFELTKITL